MKYPKLDAPRTTRQVINVFRGYDHNLRIGTGAFYHMENLTSAHYPLLAPRPPRGFYTGGTDITGLLAKDQLCYTDGKYMVIGDTRVDMDLTPGAKTLVSMGAYVVILPDKKYINTVDGSDRGSIEAEAVTEGEVTVSLCDQEGCLWQPDTVGDSEPESLTGTWLDTGASPMALKKYTSALGGWVSLGATYVKITAENIGKDFAPGDGVTLSGLGQAQEEELRALEGSFVIQARGDDYIVVPGILSESRSFSGSLTVKREMPELDHCIESGNRLWGCRYGLSPDGKTVNEIYASKLGDFKNWNCFQGVSTDSYIASCGTDGPFTGAITHLGYPLFFKEECMHKVYGSYPANFQIQTTPCRGVQKGSGRSLAIVGETLFYKSRLGICAFDGSLPVDISEALGDEVYTGAVGGAHGKRYYLSMADSQGTYHLFVYDTARAMWHREDNVKARAFCSWGSELYFLDDADGRIKTVGGSGAKDPEKVKWLAETGLLGVTDPEEKYICRVKLRARLEPDSALWVDIDYDSQEQWIPVCALRTTALGSFDVPIRPRPCDHFRLRLRGEGDVRIFSMTLITGERRRR